MLSFLRRPRLAVDTAPWSADVASTRARRIARLAAQLQVDGIAWPERLPDGDAAMDWLGRLDRWTLRHWPVTMHGDRLAPEAFFSSPWLAGPAGAQFTAIADAGFAIADVALALRPDLRWAIDRFDAHIADGVASAGRLVLVDPQVPPDAIDPQVADPFGIALLRAMQVAWKDREPLPLRDGLRGVLWSTHRHLFD